MEAEITFRKKITIREDQDVHEIAKSYIAAVGFDEVVEAVVLYDPTYGDDVLCECGHEYHRHFDTYEEMAPVGCKYCHGYEEGVTHRKPMSVTDVDTSNWTNEDWEKTLGVCTGFRRAK